MDFKSIVVYLSKFKFGNLLFAPADNSRYGVDKSFIDVIIYPNAVVDYLRVALNSDLFGTLAKFLFGYWIAKIGFIEHLQERVTWRFLLITLAVFSVCFVGNYLLNRVEVQYGSIARLNNYSASFAYALILIYAYYHCGFCNRVLRFFEPYGRLGLTNYSMGSIMGVIFINEFGLGLYEFPLSQIVLFFIGFFLLQAVFSYYWLRYFTYGPMEYVWRVATERKKIPFLKQKNN